MQVLKQQVDTIYDIPLQQQLITRHIYLTETLSDNSDYIKTCQAMLELQEGDKCELHIASGGGCVSISDMICNAMSKCQAPVRCVLESNADSAASVIFLSGDEWEVSPNATMYLHIGFFGAYGEKASDTVPDALFTQESHFNMIKNAYEGFLTEEEIESLLKGNNIRLNAEAIIERLQILSEYRQAKMEEMYLEECGETSEHCSDDQVTQTLLEDEEGNPIAFISYESDIPIEMTLINNNDIVVNLEYQVMLDIYTSDFLKNICTDYFKECKSVPKTKSLCAEKIISLCKEQII